MLPFPSVRFVPTFRSRSCTGLVLILALLSVWPRAQAQTAADLEAARRQADVIQRQQLDRLREDQEQARRAAPGAGGADLRDLAPLPPETGKGPCRLIEEVAVVGGEHLGAEARRRIATEFTGRCLDAGDIERILGLITRDYVERGYITTRAYLPAQDLTAGRLEIQVQEGRIQEYRLEDEGARRIFAPGAFPRAPGDLLNLRDLEQGIDQVNRLAANNAQMDIQPGSEPGASVVVIRNPASFPLHLQASVDNMGTESTGKQSGSVSLSADSPLGFNERWLLTRRESLPDGDKHWSTSTGVDLWVPYGYFSFGANYSESNYLNMIALPSGTLMRSNGRTVTESVMGDWVAYRDQASRLSFAARLTMQDTQNYLGNQLLVVSSRKLSYLELDASGNTLVLGGMANAQLGYIQGLTLGSSLKDASDLPADSPHAQFTKATLDAGFVRNFNLLGVDLGFSTQLSGQYAWTTLYGSQQMLIGSTSTVRGFTRNTLSGDSGYYWRNELSLPCAFSLGNERLNGRFYLGYDAGSVSNIAPGTLSGHLSGATLGLSLRWRGATWEIFGSRPLDLPNSMIRESAQTWFRLSYSL